MTTAKRFSKFQRPTEKDKGRISDRDLDIIAAVLRYRFSPASELVRLVGGNEDVTQRRLRRLWEWEIINRFAFPTLRSHSEFYYYLDNRAGLELVTEHRGFQVHPAALEEIDNNREKDYAQAAVRGTMNSTDMLTKMRAYYHFIKKQQRHKEAFGVHRSEERLGKECRSRWSPYH